MATTTGAAAQQRLRGRRSPLFSAVTGLAGLGVLLQGVWAGLFSAGGAGAGRWVSVHDWGARAVFVLAVLALVVAVVQLRRRPGVVVGAAVFAALVYGESWVGGEIGAGSAWQVLHFPLAMALLGLAVWLPLAARRG